jgi:hypothetical protein
VSPYFCLAQNTQTGKKIPNGHKIHQMAVKYANIFHSKIYPNCDFGALKLYHLATLFQSEASKTQMNSFAVKRDKHLLQ